MGNTRVQKTNRFTSRFTTDEVLKKVAMTGFVDKTQEHRLPVQKLTLSSSLYLKSLEVRLHFSHRYWPLSRSTTFLLHWSLAHACKQSPS